MEAVAFFSMFLMNMSPIPLTDVLFKTNVETNDETTDSEDDFRSCCAFETTDSDDEFMSCCDYMSFCDSSDSDHNKTGFVKMTMTHLDTWSGNTMKGFFVVGARCLSAGRT